MTKKNFITLLLGTIGGILFALGMCMGLLPEWNAFREGVILGCVGLVILLVMAMIRRRMSGKPIIIKLTGKTFASIVMGVIGTLAFGAGMCLVMAWGQMIYGILLGLVGIVLLLCLIPMVKGVK